ncbi:uncharacterized protein [Pseudochaenichthys georgianus]|uniref:uncharacterized protein n=1 Tax=Pseudochaenichthys georgianus TaxID=52239 RepID=UPI0039C10C24
MAPNLVVGQATAEATAEANESASPALPAGKSKPEVGKGDKGNGKAQKENPPPGVSYSFTEAQEEAIACWVKSKKLLYDMKDKRDEEDPILAEEASENDSDRNKFIRRVFGFLKPHIRRHNKETPASFKDKLALAETGELAGSDVSFADKSREPNQKYTGYPTPRPPSRTGTAAEDQPESPMEMRFITREQPVNRATPFCKYLETELDRLHDACLEPVYEDITTVLNHYRKMSRQFRMREAAGDQISPFVDVPSALQSQQQRPVAVNPVCTSALPSSTYFSASRAASSPSAKFQPGPSQWPKNPPPSSVWRSQECGYVEQVNQQHTLEQQQQYRTLQPASTTSQGYVPSPRQAAFFHLPSQPPQQQISGPWQLTPQQPVQGPPPPPLPAQQSQNNVTQHSLNISAVHHGAVGGWISQSD